MSSRLEYDNDYIVGGAPNAPVTPNFRLSEYAGPDGKVRVHRELAAAVQVLRSALGRSLSIASLAPADGLGDGLAGRFAWLESSGLAAELAAAASRLVEDGWFARVEPRGARVYVEMPDPQHLPAIAPDTALDRAIAVTAAFETGGDDPYQQVTGNFDGAGLSFGPLQVNFGTGTLQELFRRLRACDDVALRECFGPQWPEWEQIAKAPRAAQIAWADGLSRGPRKAGFDAQWKGALQAVGRHPAFRAETLRYAYDTYGRKLIVALSWLSGVLPIPIRNFRCLAALYDLCVQQGSLDKAHDAIRRRIADEHPQDEFHLTRIAVEERGRTANPAWRADAISRRLSILQREPVRVTEAGKTAERDNPNLYLLRNAPVNEMERYLL